MLALYGASFLENRDSQSYGSGLWSFCISKNELPAVFVEMAYTIEDSPTSVWKTRLETIIENVMTFPSLPSEQWGRFLPASSSELGDMLSTMVGPKRWRAYIFPSTILESEFRELAESLGTLAAIANIRSIEDRSFSGIFNKVQLPKSWLIMTSVYQSLPVATVLCDEVRNLDNYCEAVVGAGDSKLIERWADVAISDREQIES